MSQQVQELIDKIKVEGIETAKKSAAEMKESAEAQAKEIVKKAEAEAQQILQKSEDESKKNKESTNLILKQASRDTLLALRQQIEATLRKIIAFDVAQALNPDVLGEILEKCVTASLEKGDVSSINVELSGDDKEVLEKGFLTKLKKELKKSIELRASDDVAKGLTISYDEGKSSFEFTDESLTNFLSSYLNVKVAALLNESLKS